MLSGPSAPSHALVLALALLLAWALDALFGEPRNALHPVAWLGKLLWPLGCRLRVLAPTPAFWAGALSWLVLACGLGAIAWWLQTRLLGWSAWWAVPVLALLIKPTLAWRKLRDEVLAVEDALAEGLEPARERLSQLVSRDLSGLNEEALRETAIETLAENLNDSVIAPLFWFAVAGLPGAVVYRVANTADAMWGYHGVWEFAGKWAARADDVLSWLPARITALSLYPAWKAANWRSLRRQAGRTPSPNGGWAMGAMALRLGVRLAKPGVYVLNETGASPSSRNMVQALGYAALAAWGSMLLVVLSWVARAL
ncbi:MAG TPA: adenosylcobinamide-phosphate synthase CbiB [Rhizobacter sp.]|nr:adenosylcobinamide-phosphate synthase CbiB [Rhizobacter sp.]